MLVACLIAACCSHRCRAKLFGYTTADAAGDNNHAATNHDHDHAASSAVSTFSANATTSRAGPTSSLARGQGRKQQSAGGRATALDKDGDMDEWSHTLNEEEEGVRGHGISSFVGAGAGAGSKPTHGKGKEIPLQPLLSRAPVGHPSAPSSSSTSQQRQQQQQQQQQQQDDFDFSMENPLKQPPLPSNPVAYPFHAPSPPIGGGFAAHSSSSSSSNQGLSPSHTEIVSGAGFDDPFGNSDPFASAPPAGDDFNAFTNVPLITNESSFTAAGNRTNNGVVAKSTSKVPPPNPFQAAPPPAAAVAGSNTASWDWLDQGAAPLPKAP